MGLFSGAKKAAAAADRVADAVANRRGKVVASTAATSTERGRCVCGKKIGRGQLTCSRPACVKRAARSL